MVVGFAAYNCLYVRRTAKFILNGNMGWHKYVLTKSMASHPFKFPLRDRCPGPRTFKGQTPNIAIVERDVHSHMTRSFSSIPSLSLPLLVHHFDPLEMQQ
jgi:hypothetical protein